jgi:hypothetical protein
VQQSTGETPMSRRSRRVRPSAVAIGLLSLAFVACGRAEVDPRLIGTWQLQWAGAPIYWSIREDGTYEISGQGAGLGESGTFAAAAGRWSLRSPIRGEDGGTYELPNDDLWVGTGKLGPGVWARVRPPAQVDTPITLQREQSRDLPVDVPALLFSATRRARDWQSDAVPVWLEYQHVDAPNPAARGPQVRIAFLSPGAGTGMELTVRGSEVRTFEFNQPVNWGTTPLPPVFVDLPAAVREARENGMEGAVGRARLAVHHPPGAPEILAWSISPSAGEGRTVDGTTGAIIDFDVTGYIAAYNAQWEEAARRFRAMLRMLAPRSAGSSAVDLWPSGSDFGSSSADPAAPADTRQQDAAGRAYFANPEDYNRLLNGECDMRLNSQYGC